jgi:hypothetical protein
MTALMLDASGSEPQVRSFYRRDLCCAAQIFFVGRGHARYRHQMTLWRISYISVAVAPADAIDAVIADICAVAQARNAALDITGMLTFKSGRFAQVIEGQEAALRTLMAAIERDPRHHTLKIVADGPIELRRYSAWRMTYCDPYEFVRDQLDTVLEQTALMGRMVSDRIH